MSNEQEIDVDKALSTLLERDSRFSKKTYDFVNDVLSCAQKLNIGEEAPTETLDGEIVEDSDGRHITGEQLCRIAVALAVQSYGLMAKTVLEQMGIYSTSDLGDAVYNMIDVGLMSKTPYDAREDFDAVFELDEELESTFKFEYQGKQRRNGRR